LEGHEHSHSQEHQSVHPNSYGHAGAKKVPPVAIVAIVALVCVIAGYFAYGAFNPATSCNSDNSTSTDVCTLSTSTPGGLTAAQLSKLKTDLNDYLTTLIAINGAPDGVTAAVANITKDGDMYKASYDIMQSGSVAQSGSGYVTSDGKRLFLGSPMDLTEKLEKPTPKPAATINVTGRPFRGSETGTVTIVEFSDFQCPYCKVAAANVDTVIKNYGANVKYYLMHFPLSFHASAQKTSEAFECAMLQDQNKAWAMSDLLFEKSTSDGAKLAVADLKQYAADLSLDTAKFNKCLDENQTAAKVAADAEYGASLGVTGTPTFYVNGVEAVGGSAMQSAVEAILKG